MEFSKAVLDIDPGKEISRISEFIRESTFKKFRRRGAVVGLSGGVDSAVVAEFLVQALGKERVLALLLPEKESNPISTEYGLSQAKKLGIETVLVDITDRLKTLKVYEERDSVIRDIFPEFDSSFRFHVTLPQNLLKKDRISYHSMTIEDENGKRQTRRISAKGWLRISACQNMKQRVRMVELYHHSEMNHYIVAGTTNKTEVCQGFFVKYGDGGVDLEPISHLYKTQIYELAKKLGVIEEIIHRSPSPDTYSLPVTDKEFYFCIDYELLDLLLYAYHNNIELDDIASVMGLKHDQIKRVFSDFRAKERASWHLRQLPLSL